MHGWILKDRVSHCSLDQTLHNVNNTFFSRYVATYLLYFYIFVCLFESFLLLEIKINKGRLSWAGLGRSDSVWPVRLLRDTFSSADRKQL